MSKETKKKEEFVLKEVKPFKQKLLDARMEISNPKRGGTDNFKKRKYVTLQDLYDEVLPHLLHERLLLINRKMCSEDGHFLQTEIVDVDSNEFITTSAKLNPELKIQEQGSELTYHSRYNLGCLLSIRTDYDDDAESIKEKVAKKAGKYITPDQMYELTKVLGQLTPDVYNKLLRILNIPDFSKIPLESYEKSVKFINSYVEKNLKTVEEKDEE